MYVAGPAMHEGRGLFVIAEAFQVGYVVGFISGDIPTVIDGHDLGLMRLVAVV